jgi:NTE family protein
VVVPEFPPVPASSAAIILLMRSLLFLTVAYLLSPEVLVAQNPRPRVGLALSGGGALGLAHIGVLRYFEERRIPVDRIAGTSMGGLLGGLYATGLTAQDLERIVREADWDDLLRTTPRFEDRIVTEKQDWNRVTGPYAIPLGGGFSLPAGINSGQSLVGLLSSKTAAYWDVQSFDELPIPFRCVATDLISGNAFIFREGRLPLALRSTMAIPGVFAPVEWQGRILVDGGLVNNLPTDVVKDMGADVVIGVTMRTDRPDPEDLRTLPGVVSQTVDIAVTQNEIRRIPLADIHLVVQLGNRKGMDFSDPLSIIEMGYRAAAQNQTMLGRLSLSNEEWQQHLAARKSRERTIPAESPVTSVSAAQPRIQRNAFDELSRKENPATSSDRLKLTLDGLTAATGLPNMFFGWHSEGGRGGYQVEIETRRVTEILLRPSVFYQFSKGEPSRPTLKVSASATPRDSYKTRVLGALYLGSDPALFLEYYHPFGGSPHFLAPGLSAQRLHVSQYTREGRSDETRDRYSATLYFGLGTWRHLQLRAGARAGLDRYGTQTLFNGIETTDTTFVNPEITGIVNSQDSARLPSRGLRLNTVAGWSFRENSFPYVETNFDHFHPVARNLSLFAMGRADTSMGRKLGFYDQFTAGGLGELDAYRYQEVRGDSLLMAGGGFLYRGLNPQDSAFRPILGSWYQAASVDPWTSTSQLKQSAAVAVLTPTPLGILTLTFSTDLKGTTRWRVSLGSFWNRP